MNHATHDAGAGASPADGPWLDMSAFADLDPDDALAPGDADLLSSALAVDEGALPDDVFARMLAVTWEQPPDATPDTADLAGSSEDPSADHDAATTGTEPWTAGPDDGGDPAHHPDLDPDLDLDLDREHDHGAWGGDLA